VTTIWTKLELPPGEDEQQTWRTFLGRQSNRGVRGIRTRRNRPGTNLGADPTIAIRLARDWS
jgi:hypothetical protein